MKLVTSSLLAVNHRDKSSLGPLMRPIQGYIRRCIISASFINPYPITKDHNGQEAYNLLVLLLGTAVINQPLTWS